VQPLLGRALRREDDLAGAEGVLVITHALWRSRYGGSPDVIGRRPDYWGPTRLRSWV